MKLQISLLTISLLAVSASANLTELTTDQCVEYKDYNTISLSENQKKNLESSCKAKYTSENGVSNCLYFEAEKPKKNLKK